MSISISWQRVLIESAVIFSSILLALAADAWWDQRVEARQTARLVTALEQDFKATQKRIGASIEVADSLIARTEGFLQAIGKDEPQSINNLQHLIGGAFAEIGFEPVIPTLRSGIATGNLQQLDSAPLMDAIAEFQQAYGLFELIDRVGTDSFFLGPSWELRREIGSVQVLISDPSTLPPRLRKSEEELHEIFLLKSVYATIETVYFAQTNTKLALINMDVAAAKVLDELGEIR